MKTEEKVIDMTFSLEAKLREQINTLRELRLALMKEHYPWEIGRMGRLCQHCQRTVSQDRVFHHDDKLYHVHKCWE